jgi:hypothetical protein
MVELIYVTTAGSDLIMRATTIYSQHLSTPGCGDTPLKLALKYILEIIINS